GLAEEDQLLRIKPVAVHGAFNEGGKSLGLAADVPLVETTCRQTSKPAGKTLLRRAAAYAEKRCLRRDPMRKRHQRCLVAAATMQQHQCLIPRRLRHEEAVDEGEITARHARLARQGE